MKTLLVWFLLLSSLPCYGSRHVSFWNGTKSSGHLFETGGSVGYPAVVNLHLGFWAPDHKFPIVLRASGMMWFVNYGLDLEAGYCFHRGETFKHVVGVGVGFGADLVNNTDVAIFGTTTRNDFSYLSFRYRFYWNNFFASLGLNTGFTSNGKVPVPHPPVFLQVGWSMFVESI